MLQFAVSYAEMAEPVEKGRSESPYPRPPSSSTDSSGEGTGTPASISRSDLISDESLARRLFDSCSGKSKTGCMNAEEFVTAVTGGLCGNIFWYYLPAVFSRCMCLRPTCLVAIVIYRQVYVQTSAPIRYTVYRVSCCISLRSPLGLFIIVVWMCAKVPCRLRCEICVPCRLPGRRAAERVH